ncbi:MAG: hypothetical protein E7664_04340 [Ruminococcaceae bacterium]|nr:hypothetical protein [Oscillospiraceae bacterium]
MKCYFLINPFAGKGGAHEALRKSIHEACEARGIDVEIHLTEHVGEATEFVRRICTACPDEPLRFYACGGDGTLGETVRGAVGFPHASVGVIPVGTGNDFVRNFSDSTLFLDVGAQLDATEMEADLIACNDTVAVNMVNIGFDCEVVKKKEELKRNRFVPNKLSYVVGVVLTLLRKPGVKVTISVDGGEPKRARFLLTTFANGAFCGGGFHSNPLAALADGRLDALLVNNVSRTRFVSLVGSYKKGTHLVEKNKKLLQWQKLSEVDMTFDGVQSICIDGEITEVRSLHMHILPRSLRFLLPCGVSYAAAEDCREEATV